MRQIKFRVWDNNKKKMITETGFIKLNYANSSSVGYLEVYFEDEERWENSSDEGSCLILEQFTGLCDKDGKEIYEGDILENINMTDKRHKNAVVEWAGHRYILRCLCGVVFNHGFENISISEIKVIGNIHLRADYGKKDTAKEPEVCVYNGVKDVVYTSPHDDDIVITHKGLKCRPFCPVCGKRIEVKNERI